MMDPLQSPTAKFPKRYRLINEDKGEIGWIGAIEKLQNKFSSKIIKNKAFDCKDDCS